MLNKKLVMVALAAVALSACGKNDFNGTYTGYETASGTQSGYGMGATPVTLNLKQNDEFVTGTYTAQSSMYTGGQSQSVTGQFSASAQNSDKLDNVQLIVSQSGYGGYNGYPTGSGSGYYGSGQIYSGSLSASDDGRRLQGTLNMMGGSYGGMTTGKTLMLNRNGE